MCTTGATLTTATLVVYLLAYSIPLCLALTLLNYKSPLGVTSLAVTSSIAILMAIVMGIPPFQTFFLKLGLLGVIKAKCGIIIFLVVMVYFLCLWLTAGRALIKGLSATHSGFSYQRHLALSCVISLLAIIVVFVLDFGLVWVLLVS